MLFTIKNHYEVDNTVSTESLFGMQESPLTTLFAYSISLPMAAIVTVLLFVLMKTLVMKEFVEPIENNPPPLPEVHLVKKAPTRIYEKPIPKPVEMKTPPSVPENQFTLINEANIFLPFDNTTIDDVDIENVMYVSSGPLEKRIYAAKYPSHALANGTEGWVDVQFDVNIHGETENIVVLKANPKRIFNRAARNAVRRWLYQPTTDENGKPKRYHGLVKRIAFHIED